MFNIIKLALGSAQFGMKYGVLNGASVVGREEVAKILSLAAEAGVDTIDTAPSYGNAEEILGQLMPEKKFQLITKTPHLKSKAIEAAEISRLRNMAVSSIENLRIEALRGILVHAPVDLFTPGGHRIITELQKLKDEGLTEAIGVSIYHGDEIDFVLSNFDVDLIQLPLSILDQRLVEAGYLSKLHKRGVEIHARSVFLQGILLDEEESLPPFFEPIKGPLWNFKQKARQFGMHPIELALNFVGSFSEISRIVIGVQSLSQFSALLKIAKKSAEINNTSDEITSLAISEPKFLNPSLWKV